MKNKRLILSIMTAWLAIIAIALPVFAFTYSAPITVTENGTAAHTMASANISMNNLFLASNGFTSPQGLDTRIQTLGGLVKPHMVADNATWFATAVPLNGQVNLFYTTWNSLLSVFHMVFGNGGYFTVGDNITEPSANFSMTHVAYFDTSASAVGANITSKDNAFREWVSGTGNISASITNNSTPTDNYSAGAGTVSVYDVNWGAQSTANQTSSYLLGAVGVKICRTGTPTGLLTAHVRLSGGSLNKPIGADIASGTSNVSTLTTGAAVWWWIPLTTPKTITSGQSYALLLSIPGSAGNQITWVVDSAGAYANGVFASSADSGATWTTIPAYDFTFEFFAYPTVTAPVSSGEHTIQVSANITQLKIFIDDMVTPVNTTNLIGASVPNNANSWEFLRGGAVPYSDNVSLSVNGVQVAYYAPNAMIIGTALPDRSTDGVNNQGVITWGNNPTGVHVAIGGLVSSSQPGIGSTGETPSRDLLPPVKVSDMFVDPDLPGKLATNPLRPFVTILSDSTTISELQAWRLLGLVFVLFVTVLAAKEVPKHLVIACIAAGVATVVNVVTTIWPLYALVLLAIYVLGGIISEHKSSL